MKHISYVALLMILILLAGCEDANEAESTRTPLPSNPVIDSSPVPDASSPVPPALAFETRQEIETTYEALRQLHVAISAVWEQLAQNETVQCGTVYAIIPPASITGEEPAMQSLRQAAVELETAVQLWEAECQNPRQQPPRALIDQGVLTVRAAGDALATVEQYLKENP